MITEFIDTIKPTRPCTSKELGTIVDNQDPTQAGLVRVVTPSYEGLQVSDLPWALVLQPTGLGGSGTLSHHSVPEVGTEVLVEYLNSDGNTPIVLGTVTTANTKSTTFSGNYPESYGFEDPKGLTTVIDKTAGTVSITHVSGSSIHIDASGNISIQAAGTYTVTSAGSMAFHAPRIDFN